jgi:hypothetical protein
MSENTLQKRREAVLETAKRIDETASAAMVHFSHAGSMAAELQVAQAMVDLRALMTPEVMVPIMALQNTDIGFRTDKLYPVEVVRDVVIEAKLRGFHTIGNEFNIISGRFYAAQKGFRRKLIDGKTFPGLNNFRDIYEVPRLIGADKGALVKCKASWTLNGKPDSVEFDFPVKLNAGMGSDGALGKAERKLCKRVHDLISGISTPDGDVDESDLAGATNVTPANEQPTGPKFRKPEAAPTPPVDQPAPPAPVDAPASPAPVVAQPEPNQDLVPSLQDQLAQHVTNSGGTFDDFVTLCRNMNWVKPEVLDPWTGFADMPDALAKKFLGAKRGVENGIKAILETKAQA